MKINKHTPLAVPPHVFEFGDEAILNDDPTVHAKVVGTFCRSGQTPLVVYERTSERGGTHVAVGAEALTFTRCAAWSERFVNVPWKTFHEMIGVRDFGDDNEYAPATLDTMRASLTRITLAMELIRRGADMIRQQADNTGTIGWNWSGDEMIAQRAIALCEFADHELGDFMSACLCAITGHANDAVYEGKVA